MDGALGLVETRGFLASVVGADAALKAALVTLKGVQKVGGGLTTVVLTGEVAAMAAALSAAEAAVSGLTGHCRVHLIPRLDNQVRPVLELAGSPAGLPALALPAGDDAPRDPAHWERPLTAAPGEVVELDGPEAVLALESTPDKLRELLPAVPDSPTQKPAAKRAEAAEGDPPAEAKTPNRGERKPAVKKTAKPAIRKSRKR